MFFTARQTCAAFSDHRIVTIRQCANKIVTACFFGSFDHLFHWSVGLAKTDIVRYRIMKQIYVLEHKAKILHQRIQSISFHVNVPQLYLPGFHIPKPRNQMTNGCLTSTGRSNKRSRRLFRYGKADVVHNLSFIIRKINVLHGNIKRFRLNFPPRYIHFLHFQNLVCLIHTQINRTEQSRKLARRFQRRQCDEGSDHHNNTLRNIHASVNA